MEYKLYIAVICTFVVLIVYLLVIIKNKKLSWFIKNFVAQSTAPVLPNTQVSATDVHLKRSIYSQLNWAILLCDVLPYEKKLSKLRSVYWQ
jgi:hypothetical protein